MRRILAIVLSMVFVLAAASANASPFPAPAQRSVLVTVTGTDGTRLKGASVHFMEPGVSGFGIRRTDVNGQVTVPVSAGFSFWVRVWADNYATAERAYVPASDGNVLTVSLTPYSATLVGVVTNDRGLPVPGAKVSAWLGDLGLQAETTTDAGGLYQFDGLQARGGYTLTVEARGFQPSVQTDLTLTPGGRNQVDAALTSTAGNVTGEVYDSRSGEPAFGVTVELILSGWGVIARTTTDPYGYFGLNAPSAGTGTYQLRLYGKGYETLTSAQFTVGADTWTDFGGADRLALNPLYAEITGTVLTENGLPMENAVVELQRSGLGTVETATVDANGYYGFLQVPAGTYRVRTVPSGDREHGASAWITVAGGDRATADASAPVTDTESYGGSAIVGTVRDNLGNPVAGATVQAARGAQAVSAVTDNQGRYRLNVEANVEDAIDPDTSSGYHVWVTKEGFLPTDQHETAENAPPAMFDVRANATNRADFVLSPDTGTLAGRVLNEQGKPLSGVPVVLVQEGDAEVARATTDLAGHYRFKDLPVAKQARFLPIVKDAGYREASMDPDGQPVAPVSIRSGATVTQALTVHPATVTIQGLVSAGPDKPGNGAAVTVLRAADGKTWDTVADARGAYSIAVPAEPGTEYLVKASREDSKTGILGRTVSLTTDYGTMANLAVSPAAAITGKAYLPGGTPLPNTSVYLWAEGAATPVTLAKTDDEGNYHFPNLVPGKRYSVMLHTDVNTWSSLAPGQPIITPLTTPAPGETIWADVIAPLP
ncbi:MAG TPA: carboxypeptidase regulatory-like domain-containing protein [Symbiobacteriaceae bacterium]|nr:carboxypeptidase regulatory-like domain-containing protein [Symbiobacteriaceae bacterium]